MTDSKENIGRAIGRLTSGVYVLTCKFQGQPEGILMTWVGQAAFEPPLISLALKEGRPILDHLVPDTQFVLNVLAKGNKDIFKNFARPNIPPAERFADLSLLPENGFGPVFSSALAYMNCRVSKSVEAGDHYLVLAEVVGGEILDGEAEPMTHLRKTGFQY